MAAVLLLGLTASPSSLAQVKAWEDSLVIPTYRVDPPNPMPRFYEGRTHQGVQRRIYPYPMNDGLTRTKEDRSYPIVYFENEYVKIGVMPGMGGRIFEAVDKTNGYDFFYRQHVIKPSLIGMVGYWISGSMAWGFPHHHGPNTVKPMDSRVQELSDGGRTIWIADLDRRHRMRILVGYTVRPHSSLVEMTIRPLNRTPVVNAALFWANPSVHVDSTYQVIFPPSVRYVTQHAKREMTAWPIADRRYNGFDYTGVDVSWWKNIGVPSSFFSWNPKEDYFGGYNHGRDAGTVWIGDRHVCPGMKFWAWGNNPGGDRANSGLTDTDGHYIELMAGAYTDNQPDYSWLQPYEGKDVTMAWFPVRGLGGFTFANRNGALNLRVKNRTAVMRLNVTRPWLAARVALEAKGKTLYEEKIDIAPDRPYARDLRLPRNTAERDLVLSLFAADGKQLLSFSPEEHRPPDDPMPEPLKPPPAPKDIQTVEELYLAGLRLNQFYNASLDPAPYYEEALKRDPGDYRVNTQLGILAIRNLHWKEAEERLRTAVNRITANYTRSRDGEAQYYLGVALRAQGKIGEATDRFYEASWSAAWQTPAHTQLAEIECGRRDYETALDHADRAIATHAGNLKALGLKTIVLRKSGRTEEAERQALLTAGLDPLDHLCRNELFLIRSAAGRDREASAAFEDLRRIMRGDVQSYLELATDYGNCGCDKEAVDILSRLEDEGETYPMVYYLLGYYWSRLGDSRKAGECFRTANRMPHAYCFPSRAEEMAALECAMRVNPGDARASYYLGDLMYELQPAKAVEAWETSRSLDSTFYTVHRNLGLAYEKVQNDVPKAVLSMEKAVACNPADPRLLYELDVLYEKARVSPEKRHALLRTFQATAAGRSETLLRQATLSVQVGRYEEALDILANNFFPQWEGGREMQEATLNAYLLRGLERFDAGKAGEALLDFRTALAYPLERWGRSRIAQFHYLVGTACEALGLADSASIHYQKTIKADIGERDREYAFYHGMAQKKLNRAEDARKTFEDLLAAARKESGEDFFRQFEAGRSRDMQMAANHYVAGLAYIGLEDAPRAKNELEQAVALDPGLVWAKRYLASLGGR